jgi:hypothetical protein
MLPVEMAWEALESTPSCMLWADTTFADKLFSRFASENKYCYSSDKSRDINKTGTCNILQLL